MSIVKLDELLDFANHLADVAGEVTLAYFRRPLAIENKADASPVTIADRETEQTVRALIRKRFPEHGLLGEEHGRESDDAAYTWVIDPIDGTKSFITGMPTFGTLIALLLDGVPVLGVVDMPALAERWVGAVGRTTTHNGTFCQTRNCDQLKDAVLFATSIDMFSEPERERFDVVSSKIRFRRFGADCYAYGLLASGHVDLVIEADMQAYDYLALVTVIEGAGGKISDWHGNPLGLHSDGRVIAAGNASLHAQALAMLG